MFYVYIIYSISADRYYIGYTSDLLSHLDNHNAGAIRSTKPYRTWQMVYSESFETKSDAIKCEKEIKNKKSRKSIERLISSVV